MKNSLAFAKIAGVAALVLTSAVIGAAATYLLLNPQQTRQGMSFTEMDSLSPQDVGARLLPTLSKQLAEQAVAVSYVGSGPHGAPAMTTLEGATLRLRAKGAGFGTCVADNLNLTLAPPAGTPALRNTSLAPDGTLRIYQSYRVIGDTASDRDWTDEYAADLDRQCATVSADAMFFVLDASDDQRSLFDMLPALREAAQSADSNVSITCTGDVQACRNPLKVLQSLRPDLIFLAHTKLECADEQACVSLTYATTDRLPMETWNVNADPPAFWNVKAKGRYRGTYPNGWGKIEISELELKYGS